MRQALFASVRILIGLALCAGTAGRVGAQNSADAGHITPPAPSEQAGPALQTRVTLALDGQSLRVVLAAVAAQSGVPVRAETSLQEYRVSLHTNAQPLATVMRRLTELFQHDDLSVNNYGWTRAVEGGKTRYILTRSARAYEQEQALLDLPRARRVRWLRDMRDFARLPADKRKTFRSDNPGLQYHITTGEGFDKDPAAEAVAALTDEQMTALLQNGQVDVPQLTLSPDALAYLQRAVPHGSGGTAGFSDYNPPAHARLTMQDDGKRSAQYRGVSSLTLSFGSGFPTYCPMGHLFNTL